MFCVAYCGRTQWHQCAQDWRRAFTAHQPPERGATCLFIFALAVEGFWMDGKNVGGRLQRRNM